MPAQTDSGREVARRVLRRVDSKGAYATLALSGELERAQLSRGERALATELVYGVLRRRSRIDRALAAMTTRGRLQVAPAVLAALRVGAYQLLFLDRVPAHAAVDDAVGAVRHVGGKRIAGFANGILRRLGRQGEPPLPDRDRDLLAYVATAHSLPRWIARILESEVGAKELEVAAAALDAPAPLALRANLLRGTRAEIAERLRSEGDAVRVEESELCPEALLASGLGSPEASRSFQEGLVSVQDLGAQLVTRLTRPQPGAAILDACAGVGGKSTHLAELTGDRAAITAADLSARKLDLLGDAIRRLGLASVRPVRVDLTSPGEALAPTYDAVLLDAPCTGLGVLRRHPEAKWRLRPEQVGEMAALQGRLLDAMASRVAPGGFLVYSVCTFTREEGPAQVAAFLERHPSFVPDAWIRTWPHHHRADAFFAARLLRRSS